MPASDSKETLDLLLKAYFDGEKIGEVSASMLPVELRPVAASSSSRGQLKFEDYLGNATIHEFETRQDFVHFSIRVHGENICQADCILSNSLSIEENALLNGDVHGIRFQPLMLGSSDQFKQKLKGQGLFNRGLHFPGTVTPGNVILSCICDECRESFQLRSFHAGFGESAYFYSDSGVYTLSLPARTDGAPAPLSDHDVGKIEQLETRLPDAPDGGRFRYMNPLRCPHCSAPYIDFHDHPDLRKSEYYGNIHIGHHLIDFGNFDHG